MGHCGFCEDSQGLFERKGTESDILTIRELKVKVNLYNLINGLQLSKEQIRKILSLAEDANKLREGFYGNSDETTSSVKKTFLDLIGYLKTGKFSPKEFELQAHSKELEFERKRREYFEKINLLEGKVLEVLSESQRQILQEYRECLIPQADLKNPVNLGQAAVGTHQVKLIEEVYKLPQGSANEGMENFVNIFMGHFSKRFNLGAIGDVEKERKRLRGVMERARALSPVDFELQKVELAKELNPKMIEDLSSHAEKFFSRLSKMVGGATKVAKQFLHPMVIPILKERLSMPTLPPEYSSEDLAARAEIFGEIGPDGKTKPRLDKIFAFLRLEEKKKADFENLAIGFQKEAFKVVMIPSAQGLSPFSLMLSKGQIGGRKSEDADSVLFQKLSETIPARTSTYQEELTRLKLRFYSDVRKILSPGEYDRFVKLDVELMDINTGYDVFRGAKTGSSGLGVKSALPDSPTFLAISKTIGLNDSERNSFREIICLHQKQFRKILKSGKEGEPAPADFLIEMFSNPDNQEKKVAFFQSLQNRIPGEGATYLEKILALNGETARSLENALSPRNFAAFSGLNLDLNKIQAGYNLIIGAEVPPDQIEFSERKDSFRRKFSIGDKPLIEDLFLALSITDEEVQEKMRTCIQDGQKEAFRIFQQTGENGKIPLDNLKILGGTKESMQAFFKALLGKVKGKETTFVQELEGVKQSVNKKMETVLQRKQYIIYRSLCLELLDIQSGYDPFLEVVKKRVSDFF